MAIQYKADVLALLKAAGYPSTRIRAEKLLGQSYVQQLRKGELISWAALNTVCRLLDCQPGDLAFHRLNRRTFQKDSQRT